jgi:bilirubin oxidase
MTRLNVYAGPAGFYLLRGKAGNLDEADDLAPGVLPGPAPGLGANPFGTFYEIPIAIQDRSFNRDGSLFYAASRTFFESFLGDGFRGPFIPASDVSPIWNPEFFANTIVVNGRTWPKLEVEPRRYRFRFLNGCNSRFLILRLATDNTPQDGKIDDGNYTTLSAPFWQIGSEGGFLPNPVNLHELLMGLAERADVIIDFGAIASSLPPGTDALYLVNVGPDEPFGGGVPVEDFASADPATTGQVMKFVLVDLASTDTSTPPAALLLPSLTPLGGAGNTRQVSLNEATSTWRGFEGPIAALLGTVAFNEEEEPEAIHLGWDDPITENVIPGATEVWEMYNFTEDAHPIHIHEVQFQVVGREVIGDPNATSVAGSNDPLPWETGFKDTVIAYPGEITRVKALFDLAGRYVWHCHIVEHEDNEMMRPYCVGSCPAPP